MKNISLNFESINSSDGGISRVANLVLRFFEDRSKLNNDKKFFFIYLSKIGYSIKNLTKLKKDKFSFFLISAFQRRFRQELINGKIDQECLLISENLAKKLN